MSGKHLGVKILPVVFLPTKMLFWAFLKFEANIQHFKGFGAIKALKFNILRGLEASVAPNPLKCWIWAPYRPQTP